VTKATLQSRLDVYLELRRSLGYKTSVQEHALRDFLDYLANHSQQDPIRAETAVDWARQASERCSDRPRHSSSPGPRLSRSLEGFRTGN
jgi:hypothetical protein